MKITLLAPEIKPLKATMGLPVIKSNVFYSGLMFFNFFKALDDTKYLILFLQIWFPFDL